MNFKIPNPAPEFWRRLFSVCLLTMLGVGMSVQAQDYLPGQVMNPISQHQADEEPHYGHSVAMDGDWMAVGTPQHTQVHSGIEGGVVKVYRRQSETWDHFQSIYFPAATDLHCGTSVALSGDFLLIGCPLHQGGRAYFLRRHPDSGLFEVVAWINGGGEARCGQSVALVSQGDASDDERWAAVGCPMSTSSGSANGGTVRTYRWSWDPETGSGSWGFVQVLSHGFATAFASWRYGHSVSIDRTATGVVRVSVGMPGYQNGRGRAFMHERSVDGEWDLLGATIRALPETVQQAGDEFGYSVAVRGDFWAVGAPGAAVSSSNLDLRPGRTDLYRTVLLGWSQATHYLYTPQNGARSGHAIAMNAKEVWIGAPQFVQSDGVSGLVARFERTFDGNAAPFVAPTYMFRQGLQPDISSPFELSSGEFGSAIAVDTDNHRAVIGYPRRGFNPIVGDAQRPGQARIFEIVDRIFDDRFQSP